MDRREYTVYNDIMDGGHLDWVYHGCLVPAYKEGYGLRTSSHEIRLRKRSESCRWNIYRWDLVTF